ncbi:Pkinase-domain-containing protein [Clavulina sp. PMI_390]|nr:Pkinase-domain-containing protein [Clavulina sp. PMI_390]
MQPAVLAPATGPIALTDAFDRRFVKNKRSSGGNNLMQQFFPGDDDDEAGTADQPPVATSSRGGGGWQRIDGGSSKTDLTSGAGLPQRPSDPQGVEAPSHGAAHLPATPMEVDAPPISEPVSTVSSTPIHSTSPRKPSTALTSTAHTPTAPSAASTAPVARDYATPSASAPNLEMAASSSKKGKASDSNAPPTRDGDTYNIVSQVGEGTFGQVYKAVNSQNNTKVALKRIRMEGEKDGFPVTAMREIKLLQSLRHENIVKLHEMMVSKNGSVYMVFEYMDHDLTGILSQQQFQFTPAHLKSLCHQMLAGVAYLHHKGVIHRDMKGSNILISTQGVLKLADFGLARFYQKRRRLDYTNRVITLWYRPPELLLGATVYGPEVDMWSVGCVFFLLIGSLVGAGLLMLEHLQVHHARTLREEGCFPWHR